MQIRWAYLKRVLAGAIFGLYIAHLLFFLNPQVDITPWRLVSVTVVYGLLCGVVFGTILWLLRALRVRLVGRRDGEGYRAHGFGFVPLAAFIAATIYWTHLLAVRSFLPINAVRILAKATNLITAIAFALLLLWFFERTADRRTSRIIFVAGVLLIIVSSFFLYARRDSYRVAKQAAVVANVGTLAGERPVILVAVRNLPYDWIVTMSGEGDLPFFAATRQSSYFTRLEPFPAPSPDSLWASLATGKLPSRHGVTGRFSYRTPLNGKDAADRFLLLPSGVGLNVLARLPLVQWISAQLPAGDVLPIWTMFERLGIHTAVVAWPNANRTRASLIVPVSLFENRRGTSLGGVAQRFNGTGAARPRVLAALAADRAAMEEMGRAAADPAYGLDVLMLDGFSAMQRALHIWSNELPSRTSMKGEAVRAYAQQLDAMLAAIARAHPDHLLVVVSQSGPAAPQLADTPYLFARDLIATTDPGADDGFVLMAGSGTTHRDDPDPAQEVDVVPTILFAAGLPAGRDMDGRVLTDAFDDGFLRRNPLSVIASYEAREIVVRRERL